MWEILCIYRSIVVWPEMSLDIVFFFVFFEVITNNEVLRWNYTLAVTLNCHCVKCFSVIKHKLDVRAVRGTEPKMYCKVSEYLVLQRQRSYFSSAAHRLFLQFFPPILFFSAFFCVRQCQSVFFQRTKLNDWHRANSLTENPFLVLPSESSSSFERSAISESFLR